jgi:hypothetical protein
MKKRFSLVLSALMVSLLVSMVARATGTYDWVQVPSCTPDPENIGRKPLSAVSFSASDNGNALGYYVTSGGTNGLWQTHAQHWDGSEWKCIPSYNYPNVDNYIYGVTTVSKEDGWAVGSYQTNNGPRALILRYDDEEWVNWPITITGATQSVLYSVASDPASDDVWAVGYIMSLDNDVDAYRSLTMHWDGSSWTRVGSPNAGSGDNILYGVTRVPNSSVSWAVGAYADSNGDSRLLTMVTDTSETTPPVWTIPSSLSAPPLGCLRSTSAYSTTAVWAVGFTGNDKCFDAPVIADSVTGNNDVLIRKWNGSSWSSQTPPTLPGSIDLLYGVSVASSTRVWAVGYYAPPDTATATLVLGLNLADTTPAWKQHCSENPSGTTVWDRLLAVDALSNTEAWAVGWYYASSGNDKPTLIETYDPPDCFVE